MKAQELEVEQLEERIAEKDGGPDGSSPTHDTRRVSRVRFTS